MVPSNSGLSRRQLILIAVHEKCLAAKLQRENALLTELEDLRIEIDAELRRLFELRLPEGEEEA